MLILIGSGYNLVEIFKDPVDKESQYLLKRKREKQNYIQLMKEEFLGHVILRRIVENFLLSTLGIGMIVNKSIRQVF